MKPTHLLSLFLVGAILLISLAFWTWTPLLIAFLGATLGMAVFVLRRRSQKRVRPVARSAQPEAAREHAELAVEFELARRALERAGQRRGRGLKNLPWYLVLGSRDSGRSEVLEQSGLSFRYRSSPNARSGETRGFRFHMGEQAVFLDTPSHWLEDDQRRYWRGLVEKICASGRSTPIDGVIITLGASEAIAWGVRNAHERATRFREHLEEACEHFGIRVPIYLMVARCGETEGFKELFADLDSVERQQIWGFTSPVVRGEHVGEAVALAFDELTTAVELRSGRRMADEGSFEARQRIFGFPGRWRCIRPPLTEFVRTLFADNIFREELHLRGVYFCDVGPDGPWFMTEFFRNVVLGDRGLAVPDARTSARRRRTHLGIATAIAAITVATVVYSVSVWFHEREFLADTRARVELARAEDRRPDRATSSAMGSVSNLYPLAQRVHELQSQTAWTAPVTMREPALYQPLRGEFLRLLRTRVIDPLLRNDVQAMEAFGRRFEALGPDARPRPRLLRDMYGALRLHLLMTNAQSGEPALEGEFLEFVVDALADRWARASGVAQHDRRRAAMRFTLMTYFEGRRPPRARRAHRAVAQVRAVFTQAGDLAMAIEAIEEEIRPLGYDLSLTQLVGRGVISMSATRRVPGAFTRHAYYDLVRTMIERDAERYFCERWVVGSEPSGEEPPSARVEALRHLYARRYAQQWRLFIDSIEVSRPQDDVERLETLRQLTSGEPMRMTQLVRQVDYNLTIAALPQIREPFVGFVEFAPPSRSDRGADGDRQPRPTWTSGARRYEEQLEFALDELVAQQNGAANLDRSTRRRRALEVTQELIEERSAPWRRRFSTLLLPPLQ